MRPYLPRAPAVKLIGSDAPASDAQLQDLICEGVRTRRLNSTSIVRKLSASDRCSEPVFAPRHARAEEGDSWLLELAYSAARDARDQLVLDASDRAGAPRAMLCLPRCAPAGRQGNRTAAA